MRNWFTDLMGFEEVSPVKVRGNLILEGTRLTSKGNGNSFECGTLEIHTLNELQAMSKAVVGMSGKLRVSELVGDAGTLHRDTANAGAAFQVASQFNLLEMVSESVTPEQGLGIYSNDATQGPACAIACGAGTVYRNYFVPLDGQIGQTSAKQVDCIADVGISLGNDNGVLWRMQNGYLLPTEMGLQRITTKLNAMSDEQLDTLRSKLRIGVQSNTQVTLGDCTHLVTQMYCSALPVGYCSFPNSNWQPFAQLVLDAAYEATFCAAVINTAQTGNRSLFLTLIGGGVFRNDVEWILSAIHRSLELFQSHDLDVHIVSFGCSNPRVQKMLAEFS